MLLAVRGYVAPCATVFVGSLCFRVHDLVSLLSPDADLEFLLSFSLVAGT